MTTLRMGKRLGTTALPRALGRWIWLVPVLAVVLLGGGYWLELSIAKSMKERLASTLQTTLDANATALRIWLDSQKRFASAVSRADLVRGSVIGLTTKTRDSEDVRGVALASRELRALRDQLEPFCEAEGFPGFSVVDRRGRFVATTDDAHLGREVADRHRDLLNKILEGVALVTPPIEIEPLEGESTGTSGRPRPLQMMFAAAPVHNDGGETVAALFLWIDPETEFTGILQIAQPGDSGETYAFDANGVMLSRSRFDDQLRAVGLLPEDPEIHSALNVEIRDPGGDMTRGHATQVARDRQPLTQMARAAIDGRDGIDVDGYRDYRGVEVLGAWTWLTEHRMGVVFEIDSDEAFAPLTRLRNLAWGLFGLLAGSTLVILLATIGVSAFSRRMSDAVEEARRLGQYTLREKIGAGGMGEVYRAEHAMLRRPTAVKLLRPDRAGQKEILRFEREVQMTSQLSHPNTIRIYDYGKNSDGVFYYAMEFLPGVSLDRLVKLSGPLPPARVIHLLRQVCDSLREAHDHGMIHRDVKPANIIVGERGGLHDVAKLLDFGIVKSIGGDDDVQLTAADVMSGTPQYLSPEGIRTPADIDARADIYAVGAVGYFMLTGEVVFGSKSVMEICAQHLREPPTPPSKRLGHSVPEDLENLILKCLTKDRGGRPQSAAALFDALGACADAGSWDRDEARRWWEDHGERMTRGGAGQVPSAEVAPAPAKAPADGGESGDASVTQTIEGPRDRS